MAGRLLVCATPIGNLGDVTLRVLDALKQVEVVAAEDTRRTRKLLSRYDISVPLLSYHARNEEARMSGLLEKLAAGARIALVSDAGTPGIADPGHRLIRACIDRDIDVEVLPGPNAALTALVASGLPVDVFTFTGFPPRRAAARTRFFEELVAAGHTFVFYESPHRIVAAMADLAGVGTECRVALARELTKVYEEFVRGTAQEVAARVTTEEPRGEYVVVVAPSAPPPKPPLSGAAVARKVMELQAQGVDRKEAMRRVARECNLRRRDVYEALVQSEKGGS